MEKPVVRDVLICVASITDLEIVHRRRFRYEDAIVLHATGEFFVNRITYFVIDACRLAVWKSAPATVRLPGTVPIRSPS